jgi:hypothetical protein
MLQFYNNNDSTITRLDSVVVRFCIAVVRKSRLRRWHLEPSPSYDWTRSHCCGGKISWIWMVQSSGEEIWEDYALIPFSVIFGHEFTFSLFKSSVFHSVIFPFNLIRWINPMAQKSTGRTTVEKLWERIRIPKIRVLHKTHRLVIDLLGDLANGSKSTVRFYPSVFDKSIDTVFGVLNLQNRSAQS